MSNVKNYINQPNDDGDNAFHFTGTVFFGTEELAAAKIGNVSIANDAGYYSANGAVSVSGVAIITGGTGISGLTLAAPQAGCKADIQVATISSGTVVLTTVSGVTFDGTNNTATFNAAADRVVIIYKSATEWQIVLNNSVVLTTV